MKNSNIELKEEIIATALHPNRLFKLMKIFGKETVYNAYFI
jgi:hypothetical protein